MMPSRSRLESWRVSTHSRLEAADRAFRAPPRGSEVSTHSRLEAAESVQFMKLVFEPVSTHSRLEAADAEAGLRCVELGSAFQHTAA